ncbi:MAG TPA: WD40 repeat domain-containing protein [Planctomycetaceae bacterium]
MLRMSAIGLVLASALGLWYSTRGPHDEFATLSGHKDGIFCLSLSPDGTSVASGGGDGTVRIWDLEDRSQEAVLRGHTGRVLGLAWSPDGTTIVTGGNDNSIRIWDLTSGKEVSVWANLPRPVRGLDISDDGKTVAAALGMDVYYWPIDNRDARRVLRGHRQPISGFAFLPGGQELVTFASDKTVRIWDLATSQAVAVMPGPSGHCYGLVLSANGKTIACVGGARVHLYDAQQRVPLDPVEPNAHILCGAAISSDGRTLAIGSQDKVIVVWDIPGKRERARLNGHDFAVGPMVFLPDGHTLVTSSHDSTLKLWKVN